ncbi:DUF3426 domain-containing protein [Candidatus Thiodiazotropha sp. LNASS1]|uniref:DUF3426 domain-containing protein n=1 Tax=Candidatus Thiodiazotropha sp. LNASS1 TaxID=3096260 RepID=UPI0034DFA0BC
MEFPTSFTNDDDLQEELAQIDQNGDVAAPQPSNGEANSDGLVIESSLVSDSEVEKSLDALADEEPPVQQLSEESILEVDENSSEFDSQNQFLLERDDGLETEPDYFAAGTESQMSELLDRDSASLLLEEKGADNRLAEVISFDNHDKESLAEPEPSTSSEETITGTDSSNPVEVPTDEEESTGTVDESPAEEKSILSDEKPEQEISPESIPLEQDFIPTEEESIQSQESLDEETRFTFEEEFERPQPSRYRGYWIIGSLLLLLPLCGQITWYLRDSLVSHYAGRQILQGVCNLAGCEVPIRRDTEQIIISDRALTAHPEKEGILSLKLEMVNAAAFQQPFPRLQLSLYNDMGTIIARRTFLPDEYKADQYQSNPMMPKLRTMHVELELQDPGNEVTGFKFDFL